MDPLQVAYWFWDAWLVSWVLAAIWSARTVARPLMWSEAWRDALAFGGAVIVFGFSTPETGAGGARASSALLAPLWRTPTPSAWALVGLTAGALATCWWARLHLGRLWSGVAARKADHRVVDTGPYRLARHPIYTGLIAALLAMALIKGTLAGIIGLALAIVGFWLKARLEERFLRAELGTETYDAYSRRTPMLIPFL